MKVFFRRIHLYLALLSGLVVTVTCLTGAVLVFEEEFQHAMHHSRYFSEAGAAPLSVSSLVGVVEQARPGSRVTAIRLYSDNRRTAELSLTDKETKGKATRAQQKGGEGGKKAFVNRYTGQLVEVYEYRKSGFYTVFAMHRWLLAGDTGKLIVGISTLIFLFIIITGLVLWWPKTKGMLRQRLKIKWGANWKRVLHDYHIALGFYTALFLFAFAFTGLAWSFEWFNKGIYTLTHSSPKPAEPPHSVLPPASAAMRFSADDALAAVTQSEPRARWYNVSLPKGDSAPLTVTVLPGAAAFEAQTTAYHFDQYSGKMLQRVSFADRNTGQRVRATFKPIHTGSIWGWPSKIIALIACLLGGFFPLTGYIMWINRAYKRTRASRA